jgi:hypothetical protein
VGALLGRARLVTLAGPGGVGKTRLAREVAAPAAARAVAGAVAGTPALQPAQLRALHRRACVRSPETIRRNAYQLARERPRVLAGQRLTRCERRLGQLSRELDVERACRLGPLPTDPFRDPARHRSANA